LLRFALLLALVGALPESTPETLNKGFTDADYSRHVRELKARLPSDEFTVLIQKPFVVVGDDSPEKVQEHARRTVKWAVDHLKREYFTDDPDVILDIWLFRDSVSYEENAERLFGKKPTTPYGYFSRQHKALVMNIATGGGTLVHEIVHPFIAANFPECPSWFNEGLASLYEQCAERDGRILGRTNWRLTGLQTAIRKKKLPAFETLCGTTTRQFYDEDPGTNYSQARYLCYYLQERGLLRKFYTEFRKNHEADPTGYQTLQAVLGTEEMAEFQKRWEAWILKLAIES
jgi:hypothetical protein